MFQWFIRFPEITEFKENCTLFKENIGGKVKVTSQHNEKSIMWKGFWILFAAKIRGHNFWHFSSLPNLNIQPNVKDYF